MDQKRHDTIVYRIGRDGREVLVEFPPKSEADALVRREMKEILSEMMREYLSRMTRGEEERGRKR